MATDYVTILEKVSFKDGKAIRWERSWDDGKTWENVEHSFKELPFILINPTPELSYVIEKRYEERLR